MAQNLAIIGDVGGTNARFALCAGDPRDLQHTQILPCADHADLAGALSFWLSSWDGPRPDRACIAVAGPISGDWFEMTNNHWRFSVQDTAESLGLAQLYLCNDFEILAVAAPHLVLSDVMLIGERPVEKRRLPVSVLGAGTGLGVATAIPVGKQDWHALTGEGGHVELSAPWQFERQVIDAIRLGADAPVSAETVLSGSGMVRLHNAVVAVLGSGQVIHDAAEVGSMAEAGDAASLQTIDSFIRLLASVAGDVALTSGARGGVLIGGGIMPKLRPWLDPHRFRAAFENKRDFSQYLEPIPTALITAEFPAFIGAAAYLEHIADR